MKETINGIDVDAFKNLSKSVSKNYKKGLTQFDVETHWINGTKSLSKVRKWELGGKEVTKNFDIFSDEPIELLGENQAANAQEYLLVSLNACIAVGYVIHTSLKNIKLTSLKIKTKGNLDLRGFLGLDKDIKPGFEKIQYELVITGDGTQEQMNEIHEKVKITSPNYSSLINAVAINSKLTYNMQTLEN